MEAIISYQQLVSHSQNKEKIYLLLYKKGSEKSDCAYRNIVLGEEKSKIANIYYADVNTTKDIHTQYGVSSVPALLEFENGIMKNIIKGCNDAKFYQALFDDAVYFAETKNDEKPQKRVTVYSTPTCSWCNTLKSYLKMHRVRYTDIDVSRDQRAADELVKRSGQMGVPQTDINGEIIVGFNKARINELLDIKG
jgi:glutaredoxin-like YruB-family protein